MDQLVKEAVKNAGAGKWDRFVQNVDDIASADPEAFRSNLDELNKELVKKHILPGLQISNGEGNLPSKIKSIDGINAVGELYATDVAGNILIVDLDHTALVTDATATANLRALFGGIDQADAESPPKPTTVSYPDGTKTQFIYNDKQFVHPDLHSYMRLEDGMYQELGPDGNALGKPKRMIVDHKGNYTVFDLAEHAVHYRQITGAQSDLKINPKDGKTITDLIRSDGKTFEHFQRLPDGKYRSVGQDGSVIRSEIPIEITLADPVNGGYLITELGQNGKTNSSVWYKPDASMVHYDRHHRATAVVYPDKSQRIFERTRHGRIESVSDLGSQGNLTSVWKVENDKLVQYDASGKAVPDVSFYGSPSINDKTGEYSTVDLYGGIHTFQTDGSEKIDSPPIDLPADPVHYEADSDE
jgi:hypothetical protein